VRAFSMAAAAGVPAPGTCRPLSRLVAVIARFVASWWCRFVVGSVSRAWPGLVCSSAGQRKDPRRPARVPLGPDVAPLLAAFPSSPTGLLPGAGNEAGKAQKADADQSKKVEEKLGKGELAGRGQRALDDVDAPTVRRHGDGDEFASFIPVAHVDLRFRQGARSLDEADAAVYLGRRSGRVAGPGRAALRCSCGGFIARSDSHAYGPAFMPAPGAWFGRQVGRARSLRRRSETSAPGRVEAMSPRHGPAARVRLPPVARDHGDPGGRPGRTPSPRGMVRRPGSGYHPMRRDHGDPGARAGRTPSPRGMVRSPTRRPQLVTAQEM